MATPLLRRRTMSETLSEILSALGDLIDEIKEWELEHDDYFYPDSDEKLVARRDDIRERLVACGDAAIEPLEDYLYGIQIHAYIITVDVLAEIGSPAAIQRLVDVVELGHDQLPNYAARTLAEIGAGSVQPLIERITDQLDNPVVDEKGDEADITDMVDALSGIVDPRSFDFMVELLDRFKDTERFEDLAHLCSRFHDQHNPEIIPLLRALVNEYDDCDDSSNQVAVDARDAIRCLEVDQAIDSDDWVIYGCCNICRDYDHHKKWCRAFEEHKTFDHFCLECEPIEDFRCDVCHLKRVLSAPDDSDIAADSCNIDNMPPVYANLRCHLEQEEFSDRFKITANYDYVGGLIVLTNDHSIEFCFWYDTLDDLGMLRDFFRGKRSHFPGEMRFFINCGELLGKPDLDIDGESGKAVRNDRGVATAIYECDQFGLELAFDQEAIDVLVAIIDTQRFLLLCDSYTRLDEFYENKDDIISTIKSLKESGKLSELSELGGLAEELGIEEPQPCDHEFELLKTHKKYTVYQCTRCGETKKEFN